MRGVIDTMKHDAVITIVLNCISVATVAAMVISVILQSGPPERFVSRTAGVLLILCTLLSRRLSTKRADTRVGSPLENILVFLSISSGLVLSYLIFVARDDLGNRKFYVVTTVILGGLAMIVSKFAGKTSR